VSKKADDFLRGSRRGFAMPAAMAGGDAQRPMNTREVCSAGNTGAFMAIWFVAPFSKSRSFSRVKPTHAHPQLKDSGVST